MKGGVRQVVIDRAEQRCERCRRYLHEERASLHHRKLRSRGGEDSAANLVLLCGTGTTGCHGWVHLNPREATAAGFMVPSWEEPEAVPIRTPRGRFLLGAEYAEVADPEFPGEQPPATVQELLEGLS